MIAIGQSLRLSLSVIAFTSQFSVAKTSPITTCKFTKPSFLLQIFSPPHTILFPTHTPLYLFSCLPLYLLPPNKRALSPRYLRSLLQLLKRIPLFCLPWRCLQRAISQFITNLSQIFFKISCKNIWSCRGNPLPLHSLLRNKRSQAQGRRGGSMIETPERFKKFKNFSRKILVIQKFFLTLHSQNERRFSL